MVYALVSSAVRLTLALAGLSSGLLIGSIFWYMLSFMYVRKGFGLLFTLPHFCWMHFLPIQQFLFVDENGSTR